MTMSNEVMAELIEVKRFLKSLGYEFFADSDDSHWLIEYKDELSFFGTFEGALQEGLEHWLKMQLGVLWRPIAVIVLEHPSRPLFESTRKNIRQAIAYLEVLSEGG